MFGGVLKWLVRQFESDADADEESEETEFVPSVLDASVRYAHGESNTGLEKEVAKIHEEAQRLEEERNE